MSDKNEIIKFEQTGIRRVWHNEQWYFSVLDIIEILTSTLNPTDYFKKLRKRDEQLKIYVGTNCPQIALQGKTGKKRKTTVANRKTLFRIIQSIPSPNAEPFKLWLAELGETRLLENANPSLAIERVRQGYKDLGYTDDWIDTRLQTIAGRIELTDEWKNRKVKEGKEYAFLTAMISRNTFGVNPSKHKAIKGLKNENLRDHMNRIELIFTQLGEAQTKEESIRNDAQGYNENAQAAKKGGQAAGAARQAFEKQSGQKVVSPDNFKGQIKEAKEQKKLKSKNDNK